MAEHLIRCVITKGVVCVSCGDFCYLDQVPECKGCPLVCPQLLESDSSDNNETFDKGH